MNHTSAFYRWQAMTVAALAFVWASSRAQADMSFPGDPVPLADVAGKPGAFRVTLTERSPLSTPAEIIKRMHLKNVPAEDYDWAKEVYDLYVPKGPAEGGKYGLMVGAVFKNYGAPPGEWGDLLEKHHVIWICSEGVGEGQPELRRMGTMLDAAHNVHKTYAVQDDRTYGSIGSWKGPVAGAALHYADVFDGGALYTVGWQWFLKVRTPKGLFWNVDEMTRPDPERMELAKSRCRYFFVNRKEETDPEGDKNTEIVKRSYPAAGITSVKLISVTPEQMGHYGAYDPMIFEEAITFLDAPLSKLPPKVAHKAATPPVGQGATAEVKPSAPTPPPAPTADDTAQQASKALAMAKNYLALQKYDAARPKLQKIIETYPGTPAAKEAKALLKEIEGK